MQPDDEQEKQDERRGGGAALPSLALGRRTTYLEQMPEQEANPESETGASFYDDEKWLWWSLAPGNFLTWESILFTSTTSRCLLFFHAVFVFLEESLVAEALR
eukprot:scaffold1667_cov173-Amphora_coffeaeformis.AAC.23